MIAYLLLIFIPFLGFVCAFLLSTLEAVFQKRINSIYGGLITTFGILASFLLSIKLFFTHLSCEVGSVNLKFADWIVLGTGFFDRSTHLAVHWGLLFDAITLVMCVVITFVSLLVHLYSLEYMSHDPSRNRFMSYLSLFVFFMLILVTADNYLQAFIGWEGVGLVSYLLISFWFMRVEAARSALKAVAVNKLGDFGFVLALVFMFFYFHSLDYQTVFAWAPQLTSVNTAFPFDVSAPTLIGIFLLIAAAGKSAQLGLHTWLPDAMEGPTPVSALIHAATMVTAGVYLVVRSSPLLELSPLVLSLIVFFGASTALFGASTALFQSDIKKIIAYSTCSQLGYMFMAAGLSAYSAAMFHLFTHAFFKALLFLGAGSVIHGLADEQDIRRMGGLSLVLPFTYSAFLVGSFSLMGLPFLSGYYSKDLILEIAGSSHTFLGHYAYWAGILAAVFTSCYSARLIYLVFLTQTNARRQAIDHAHEPAPAMLYPLILLLGLSVVAGFAFEPVFFSDNFWGSSVYVAVSNVVAMDDIHAIGYVFKLLPTCLVLCSFFGILAVYHFANGILGDWLIRNSFFRAVHAFFNKKWYFDHFYGYFFIRRGYLLFYSWIFKVYERGILNGLLVGLSISLTLLGIRILKRIHSGYIYHYAFFIFLSVSVSLVSLLV